MQSYRNRRSYSTSSRYLLEQFKWDMSDHPAYSPDLATSDFNLFLELKNWFEDQSFQKMEELRSNVTAHVTSLTATFFEEGIGNLVYRQQGKWRKRKAKTKKENRKYINKQEKHKSELLGKQPLASIKIRSMCDASEDEAYLSSY
ncbi:hypothetical protein AVEN_47945-1 [Araneus ventricosus]|uniref:Histone-lysine N-methyltransferase SETMAR n=1 Tax=Araneus ventricosus TaxID=182803 RepID=A0A4Y2DSG5_ARAVE|nr:hypothetical protein AVEN_47945-1 [Araneus ventricosus]